MPDPSSPFRESTPDNERNNSKGQGKEKLKLTLPMKRAVDVPAVSQPAKKCKTPQDLIKEVADAEREVRLAMNQSNAQQRTAHEQIKHQAARDTAVELECMRLKAQREEGAAQCAHELAMMEKQIELTQLQHGGLVGSSAVIDPRLRN
jgi:hypothetical protein